MFSRKLIQVAIAMTLATQAYAAGTSPGAVAPQADPGVSQISPDSRAKAEEIAAINERLGVLTARLAELEMQAKITTKLDEINRSKSSGYDTNDLPIVTGISGVDSVLKATLMLTNGRTQSARIGDMVGSWKITDIQMDSVTVKQGKQSVKLGFGSAQSAKTPQPASAQGVPAIPQ